MITPSCKNCSYYYVAKYIGEELGFVYPYDYYKTSVIICHCFDPLVTPIPLLKPLYWCDTQYFESRAYLFKQRVKMIVPTKWNYELMKNYANVLGVVPRCIKSPYKSYNKEYDYVIFATDMERKNVGLVLKHIKGKYIAICPECPIKPFTLTQEQKFEILGKARLLVWLVNSESPGMPPIEAMSVGTAVLYTDSPYVNEYLTTKFNIGVKPISTTVASDRYGYYYKVHFDESEIERIFNELIGYEYDVNEVINYAQDFDCKKVKDTLLKYLNT
jgi:glycosyltransferase involved in cell wall biosynthesis